MLEVQSADTVIVKHLQKTAFYKEVECLQSHTSVQRSSHIVRLEPFIGDDGLLRVGGRLQHVPIADYTKHPIILPKDCFVTQLIVRHAQEVESNHALRVRVCDVSLAWEILDTKTKY